jgi:ABC-type phosphate/phosphonate transport system substrate-binding protein
MAMVVKPGAAFQLRLSTCLQRMGIEVLCVTFALITRYEPHIIEELRVLCTSPPAPCLPYVTSVRSPDDVVQKLRAGLEAAFRDPGLVNCREALMLSGVRTVPLSDYDRIAEYEAQAIAMGYPDLQ